MNIPYALILKTNNGIFCIIISKSRAEEGVRIHQYKEFAVYAFKSKMSRKSEIGKDVKRQHSYCWPQSNCECNINSNLSYSTNDIIN